MRNDSMICEALQRTLRESRRLTGEQVTHIDECDACMDAWLTAALDQKPEVAIPEDFAARVSAGLPARRPQRAIKRRPRWGLAAAMAVVTLLLVVCFAEPTPASSLADAPAHSWIGLVFLFLVTAEITALALWLGPRRMGRQR
jgi:hypothetical protein